MKTRPRKSLVSLECQKGTSASSQGGEKKKKKRKKAVFPSTYVKCGS